MTGSEYSLGFRILGSCSEARRLVDAGAALAAHAACDPRAQLDRECYLSAFQFGEDIRRHLMETGSTAGFSGLCWSPFLWWDLDSEGNLERAQSEAEALAESLVNRYGINPDDVLMFFSGSKGFHVGLPTGLWLPAPSVDFHRTARRFAAHVADAAAVTIDTGVYDRVRAFRAPNSRHPKTGLHKRRLTFAELSGPLDGILELARTPAPFTIPAPAGTSEAARADWLAAADQVACESEAKAVRRTAGTGAMLTRSTLAFIREGASQGDRHRLLFSAAANLGEFGCSPALAHALLTEAGLDSGLAPKDVHRQIDCGLAAAGSQSPPDAATPMDDATSSRVAPASAPSTAPPPTAADLTSLWSRPALSASTTSVSAPDLAALWNGSTPPARASTPAEPPPWGVTSLIDPSRYVPPKPKAPPPTVPPGAKLFLVDEKMRPCSRAACHCWTWEGASRWFHTADVPPPSAESEGRP